LKVGVPRTKNSFHYLGWLINFIGTFRAKLFIWALWVSKQGIGLRRIGLGINFDSYYSFNWLGEFWVLWGWPGGAYFG